jgi:hypothetical protein
MIPLPDKARVLSLLNRTRGEGESPLRVGVAFEGLRPRRWVAAFVAFLEELPGITVLPIPGQGATPPKAPSGLMGVLYSGVRRTFDPFGEAETEWSGVVAANADPIEAATGLDLGLLIWLAPGFTGPLEPRRLATHGALTVRLGHGDGPIPFWEEVAADEETSHVTIFWHDSTLSKGRPVRHAETGTVQGFAFTRNAREPLVAVMQMLAELSLGFACDGRAHEDALREVPEQSTEYPETGRYPTAVEAGRFLARKTIRSASLRLASRGRIEKWFVGIRPNTGRSIADPGAGRLEGFREIAVPRGSLEMADPFLLEHEGRTWLLFEEVKKGGRKGRLACVEVSEAGTCSEMEVFMERDDHLSYPCVVANGKDLFLMPESAGTGRVDLFYFSVFPSRL